MDIKVVLTPDGVCLKLDLGQDIEVSVALDGDGSKLPGVGTVFGHRNYLAIYKGEENITNKLLGEGHFEGVDADDLFGALVVARVHASRLQKLAELKTVNKEQDDART